MCLQRGQSPARASRPSRLAGRALIAGLALLASTVPALAQQRPAPPACADRPVFAWLDFWVGEWRVFVGDAQVGTNRIEKILDGCAISESWTDARGGTGRSLFYVSPSDGWRQVWVTNTALAPGGVKEKRLVARLPDGTLRFQGEIRAADGVILDRTTLAPLDGGRVRQMIERSEDGGVTWTTGFDAIYVRADPKQGAPVR